METISILEKHKNQIIETWKMEVRFRVPEVCDHSSLAIENDMPHFLDALIDALRKEPNNKLEYHSQEHGLNRAKFREYTIGHIIKEYNLLKRTVFEVLDKHKPLKQDERDVIMHIIDQAVEQAVESYHRSKQQVLVDARKMAEKKATELSLVDEKRENFIKSISHDLNSPLANVVTAVSLLEKDLKPEQVNTLLDIIRSSLDKADALIKDFLNITAVDVNNDLPVQKSDTNIVEDLKKEIAVYRISRNRPIKFETNQENIIAYIDIQLVRRGFDNLLNNALKHGDADSEIIVGCYQRDGEVVISVKNSGNEIPSAVFKNIYNRYYQIDNKSKGWGIGLAFVRQVARAHGGTIEASRDGNFNVFKLTLPLRSVT